MNTDAINTMIDTFIRLDKAALPEHPDKGFNIGNIDHNCGSAFCVAGWATFLFQNSIEYGARRARGLLGLEHFTSQALFFPNASYGCDYDYCDNTEKFTLRAAIRVLQILRDTGEVNWNEAIANPWKSEDEAPAKPTFKADAWLDSILGNSDEMAVPLLEGPKRETAK